MKFRTGYVILSGHFLFEMIKKIFLGVLLNGVALYAVSLVLTDLHYSGGIRFFIIGGLIIGFLNAFIKPLMKILALPLIFLTVGLFSWVINIIIFWLTVQATNAINISGVSVQIGSSLTYVLAAFVFTVVNWVLHLIIRNK